jgi:glycogen debranching enzyme
VNQGWKDSWDGVSFADGTLATPPIALAEVQGYTYAAYRYRAELARVCDDEPTADRLSHKADELKKRFNESFWLADRGWFAVALDAAKRPVDALTSNIGHCLWTGIVDDDKAASVVEHLMSPEMFSGWGIRTLASTMGAYDPLSYHNGSVWPHDNALCVSGMVRYGFVEQAQRVAEAVLDAATHFGHRLPELFCGYSRAHVPVPVPYPAACSPQAWAAAAPLELLRALLGFQPRVTSGVLHFSPSVPFRYLPLRLKNIGLGEGRSVDLDVDIHDWGVRGLDGTDVRLVASPAEH